MLGQRRTGVLCHLTSLPDPHLGQEGALRFIETLHGMGVDVWQVLPIHPPDPHGSPYASPSAFAGWSALNDPTREPATADEVNAFLDTEGDWAADLARFTVLKHHHDGAPWTAWPAPLRDRQPAAMAQFDTDHAAAIHDVLSEQAGFNRDWMRMRTVAEAHNVQVFGDIPFFVAHDSSDVWAAPDRFLLDASGNPTVVSGVPPDYFSEDGQRWGTPLYAWGVHSAEGFAWWRRRMERMFALFDLVRIDHFRAVDSAWAIPADHPTARDGTWTSGPGDALLDAIRAPDGKHLVAEDLGIIPARVLDLRDRHGLPGMAVLHFADEQPTNPHRPEHHTENTVVYTGTHDNDTTVGWGQRPLNDVLEDALSSPACLAVIPLQDVMGLGSEARMNTPGTVDGNWGWRFAWADLNRPDVARFRAAVATHRPS
ncbi:MAG TPA: 4-alpha-glucanotransferase [Candidatus Poseidoniaceae archaeon]|nr:MAG TPA: 4-alpha-glucanotransferase [Candidatus Poseidoniales archaeon]HIH53464.1 4-alpha-glucanotransferase [Candidatus Poseidoniaceae archaeon]